MIHEYKSHKFEGCRLFFSIEIFLNFKNEVTCKLAVYLSKLDSKKCSIMLIQRSTNC